MAVQRLLVVCAVREEADAVVAGFAEVADTDLGPGVLRRCAGDGVVVDVAWAAMGPAAVAAVAAAHLGRGYDAALSVGIAGAFHGSDVGVPDVVVADKIVHGDLGAMLDTGYVAFPTLGFDEETDRSTPPPAAVEELLRRGREAGLAVHRGTMLTVSTFTGTNARAVELFESTAAVAEAMEGAGIATACGLFGVPALEIRTMSNMVGAGHETWDMPGSFAAITAATRAMLGRPLPLS